MKKNYNNQFPLANFPFPKRWRRMGNGGTGQYTTGLFCCSFLFRLSSAAVWGLPWARILQDKLALSWGPPQAAGMSMIQHLELILFTLVSVGVFLTLFSPFTSYWLCPFWNLFPLGCHSLAVGLSHALQWVGWSCLPGLPLTDTTLLPSRIKALPHIPRTPR